MADEIQMPAVESAPVAEKELPKVKQCQEQESDQFGAVAVKCAIPGLDWAVMTPNNGGHYATDAEVSDWKTLP